MLSAILAMTLVMPVAAKDLTDFPPKNLANVVAFYLVFTANCKGDFTPAAKLSFGRALELVDKQLLDAEWKEINDKRIQVGSNQDWCMMARAIGMDRFLMGQ
jgi:hypothetical protein